MAPRKVCVTTSFTLLENAGNAFLAKLSAEICQEYFMRSFNNMKKMTELAYSSKETIFIAFLCESQDQQFEKVKGGSGPLILPVTPPQVKTTFKLRIDNSSIVQLPSVLGQINPICNENGIVYTEPSTEIPCRPAASSS